MLAAFVSKSQLSISPGLLALVEAGQRALPFGSLVLSQSVSSNAVESSAPSSTSSTTGLQGLQSLAGLRAAIDAKQHKERLLNRSWVWYDVQDEREWQRKELTQQFKDAGHAYLKGVPQSMKKMNRILDLVRGLHYDEAMAQCRMHPHKAARYAEQVLEKACEDAVDKELDRSRLVVDTLYATKGTYHKKPGYKAKGVATMLITRTCHVKATLREAPPQAPGGFRARTLPAMITRVRAQPRALPPIHSL